ncbi:MAG: pilus assembly protein [Litoreibacter sp.]|nr:pilus assembly protein [Litoreibacter sp.]
MFSVLKSFICDECGAVTVDWVILTAGVVSLALAAVGVITDGTENISADIETQLEQDVISTSFESGGDI